VNGLVVNGERIESSTIIWTAGVVATPVAKWLGVEADRAGRVNVQPDMSVPGLTDVFVIGDAAHLEEDGHLLPGVAPVAIQQGKFVARLIRDKLNGKLDARSFHYFDKGNLATIGRGFAVVELGRWRLAGPLAWYAWVVIHIWYLIGFRNRLVVMLQWAWAYVTYQRGARLITDTASPMPVLASTPSAAPQTAEDSRRRPAAQ
jgi:NADH dehydrogenase